MVPGLQPCYTAVHHGRHEPREDFEDNSRSTLLAEAACRKRCLRINRVCVWGGREWSKHFSVCNFSLIRIGRLLTSYF